SDVKVKLSDPRPVIIHGDGEEVTAQALVETGNYKKSISFKDVGEMEFTQTAKLSEVELSAEGENGTVSAELLSKIYKNQLELESEGKIDISQLADLENVKVDLKGKNGSVRIKTVTENYKNKGKVDGEGEVSLKETADLESLNLSIHGENGSARSLTVTESLNSGGSVNSVGNLSISTVLNHPKIDLEIDGNGGRAATHAISDELYEKELSVDSIGEIKLSQLVDRHQVELNLNWTKGDVKSQTSTPNQETTVVLEDAEGEMEEELTVNEEDSTSDSDNEKTDVSSQDKTQEPGGNEEDVKTESPSDKAGEKDNQAKSETSSEKIEARVQLETGEDAKLTIIKMNPRGSEPVATDEEIVSMRMGMDISEARAHIRDNGGMSEIDYAWEKANSFNPTPPSKEVAGKAGGFAGPKSVSINSLSQPEVYRLHLKGPEYKGFLKKSELFMRLYYPTNGHRIRGVRTTITVAKAEKRNDILLVQEIPYNIEKDYYHYGFEEGDWLVDFETLQGPYTLLIDAGQSLNINLPIKITEDGRIIPRNGV
ncbi:MAG: hypothetical protein V5A79_05840, partial [Candidatus Bipolaricaulota bacterium]